MFNDYDAEGYRTTVTGCRSHKTEDLAIVSNLRSRWPTELRDYSDVYLVNTYDYFAQSDVFGDNDARFLTFLAYMES